ncbi:MAG: hypothetical protein K0U84_24670, partial [Actinomycetia bacterium]|nr:hypothetical protein [Actinomycetes bacterium]
LLREFGRNAEALAVVNEALRLDPGSPDVLVMRGDIAAAHRVGYNPEAQYLEALRRDPTHALAMHNLAVVRLRWGTLTRAVGGLITAARLDPTLGPSALDNIGVALMRVLRMATASVVFMFVAVSCVAAAHEDGLPTVIPRIAAAVLVAVLAYPIVWVLQTVPWPMLKAALRQRRVLAVRIGFVSYAALVGLATVLTGSNPATAIAGGVLLPAYIGLMWLGWLADR